MNPGCPDCNAELSHEDTFGNIDHCLEAIGHPTGPYDRKRTPVKRGDTYWCAACESHFHTFDGDQNLHNGYPC